MRRSGGLVGLVVVSVLLAAWVTAGAASVSIIEPRSGTSAEELQQQQESPAPDEEGRLEPSTGDLPAWFERSLEVASVALVLVLLAWLAWAGLDAFRSRRRFRTALARPDVPDHEVQGAFLDEAHRELTTATRHQLAALREGAPRNAIVACWVALEDAVELAGVPRYAFETSTEFTERVIGLITVDGSAIAALGALYREARFSRHDLGEAHRDRAIALLLQLSEDLDRALSHPSTAREVPDGATAPTDGRSG